MVSSKSEAEFHLDNKPLIPSEGKKDVWLAIRGLRPTNRVLEPRTVLRLAFQQTDGAFYLPLITEAGLLCWC